MRSASTTPEEYLISLPEDRKPVMTELRNIILQNLPKGYLETITYGMLSYVVPHSVYPNGYHCDPKQPLPFMSIASQKNFIALYHMGLYSDENLLNWFKNEYSENCSAKLDMGKSCIRFKKINEIPMLLVGRLTSKVSVNDWIASYEKSWIKSKKDKDGIESVNDNRKK